MWRGYLFILATIILTVYGQIILKARINLLKDSVNNNIKLIVAALTDPLTLTGYLAAFLASLCWLLTLKYLPLYIAYPFMGLNIVLVIVIEHVIWHTSINFIQLIGIGLVVSGLIIIGLWTGRI